MWDNVKMIATLNGTIAEKLIDVIVLDVGGVGYGLSVTAEDYGRLLAGQKARLYVYEHVRESSFDLYGFTELDTKRLFELLLGVNGIGPKMALNVLSIGSASHVKSAIASGDTKFIIRANGVGKRVAERIVVELKDKVGVWGAELDTGVLFQSDGSLMRDEAVEALVALGYTPMDAVKALKGIEDTLPTEERVKQALRSPK